MLFMQVTLDEAVAGGCALGTKMSRLLRLEIVVVVKDTLSSRGRGHYGFWREEEVWGCCLALRPGVRVWRRDTLGNHGRVIVVVVVQVIYMCLVDVRLQVWQVAPFSDTAATGRRIGVWDNDEAALSVVRRRRGLGRGRWVNGVEEAVLVDSTTCVSGRIALCAGLILDRGCGRPCWRTGARGVLLGSGAARVVRGGAVVAIVAIVAGVAVVAVVAVVVAILVTGVAVGTARGRSVGRGIVGALLLMARAAVVAAVTSGVGHGGWREKVRRTGEQVSEMRPRLVYDRRQTADGRRHRRQRGCTRLHRWSNLTWRGLRIGR
jgi:hypothetical protein